MRKIKYQIPNIKAPSRIRGLAAIAAALLLVVSCRPPTRKETAKPIETEGLKVAVQEVGRQSIENRLSLTGVLTPNQQVMVFSKVSGKLVEVNVKEGQTVSPDEVVASVNRDEPGQEFRNYQVKAPAAGVIAKVMLDPGSTVGPSVPVATIVDISNVKVTVNVIESDVGQVRIGQPADITVPAYPNRTFHGSVSNVLPMVDPVSHTTKVELVIANSGLLLKPGMSARVSLKLGTHSNVVVIPRSAIIEKMGERYVYLFVNGASKRSNVETGYRDEANVEVFSGVTAGDRLVVSDLEVLKDGTKIQVKDMKPPMNADERR
jgi:multidrug efflux pump subunit AcrA (membrane-fusion protein)